MRSLIFRVAIIILGAQQVACVKMRNSDDTGNYTRQELFRQVASGTWQSLCFAIGGGVYGKNLVIFAQDTYSYTVTQIQWAESSCSIPAAKLTSLYSQLGYDIQNDGPSANQYVVTTTVLDGTTTYYNSGVTTANTVHSCGFTNWINGVSQSWFLPSEDCRSSLSFTVQPKVGMTHYTRAKFDYSVSPAIFMLGADLFPNQSLNTLSSTYSPIVYYRSSN